MDNDSNSSWRAGLPQGSRKKIVKRIMDTLQRHWPATGQMSTGDFLKIASHLEEKRFYAAADQEDYLRRISLKILSLERKAQATSANAMQGSLGGAEGILKLLDSGNILLTQSEAQNLSSAVQLLGQVASQAQQRQQLVAQSLRNNLTANLIQSSSGFGSSLSTLTGMPRLPQPGAIIPQQPVMYDLQQHHHHQKQRAFLESSTASINSSSQSGAVVGFDHREVVWPKLQVLRDKYLQDMLELYGTITTRSTMSMPPEQSQNLQDNRNVLHLLISNSTVSKERMSREFNQDKMEAFEKQIVRIVENLKRRSQRC